MVRRILFALIAICAVSFPAGAQNPTSQPLAFNLPATINVFLDCNFCESDFVRQEIPYVDWVRDRTVADVHLLATSQSTGGGGTEYVITFIGLRNFSQIVDTLRYVASVNDTPVDRRSGYTRMIKAGLVPFLSRTSVASRLNISVAAPPATGARAQTTPERDPWRAWVFTLSGNSFTNGEKSYQFFNGFFYGQASRTTTAWKSIVGGDFSYDDSKSTVENGNFAGDADTTYVTIRRNWSAYGTQYRAITEHLSAGVTGSLGSNSYSNQDRYARAKLGVEYNLFPYSESTRRQMRLQYGAGVSHFNYTDTTIYFETERTAPIHYVALLGSARQPWGNLNANITHTEFLNQRSMRNTRFNGNMSVRIMRGLNVNMSGSYSWIHDQHYLRKGSATTTNVLLRQQALRTSYSYHGSFGLSYTFGSIFNNVVFPRFGGSDMF